jgi:hypothetical protein
MRLRTLAKIIVTSSVALFCVAVGYYGLDRLNVANQNRERSLYEFVPDDCLGVMESDNAGFYMSLLPQMNYAPRLLQFQSLELFNYLFSGLDEYATAKAHGLSSQMSHMLVSFHAPGTPRDQVVYFRTGIGEDRILVDMLRDRLKSDFRPKKEKYRGRTLTIYPLNDEDYLTTFSDGDVLVVSFQKRLIEQVIDAKQDERSLQHDAVFMQAQSHRKNHHYLTFYSRGTAVPYLTTDSTAWSDYDLHFNSDIIYLSGDTYMSDSLRVMHHLDNLLPLIPDLKEDSLILSARRDSITEYITDAYNREEGAHTHVLFNECVAGMSTDAMFMLVVDMEEATRHPERYPSFIPSFLMENAPLFGSFVYSSQLSMVNNRLSHILMLTYKD